MGKRKDAKKGKRAATETDSSPSRSEARELLESMRSDLLTLEHFLESEESAISAKVSSKRLARLRLVSEDLDSAQKLAGRSVSS